MVISASFHLLFLIASSATSRISSREGFLSHLIISSFLNFNITFPALSSSLNPRSPRKCFSSSQKGEIDPSIGFLKNIFLTSGLPAGCRKIDYYLPAIRHNLGGERLCRSPANRKRDCLILLLE